MTGSVQATLTELEVGAPMDLCSHHHPDGAQDHLLGGPGHPPLLRRGGPGHQAG